jgi:hypothetical protein
LMTHQNRHNHTRMYYTYHLNFPMPCPW